MHLQLEAVGRLGKDPEVLESKAGKAYVKLSVACEEKKGETVWVTALVFGNSADFCKSYLTKGAVVLVSGTPKISAYTAKGTGEAKASLELFAEKVKVISFGPKKEDAPF